MSYRSILRRAESHKVSLAVAPSSTKSQDIINEPRIAERLVLIQVNRMHGRSSMRAHSVQFHLLLF